MAVFFNAPVTPAALTAFVREVPIQSFFGPRFEFEYVDSNEVEINTLTRKNGVARYRSFDGRIHVADRGIATGGKVKLPALSDSLNMGEYERLQLQFAQTGGTRVEALEKAIYDDAEQLTRNIHNRLDLAVGDVLADGVLSIVNDTDGFTATIDYGVPAENKPTAAKSWTDPTADVIGDLMAWTDIVAAKTGTGPASLEMDLSVLRALQRNQGLIGYLGGQGRTILPMEDLRSILGSEFNLSIGTISGSYDVDGVMTPVFPKDRVLLLPANPSSLLTITMGVTATALELISSNVAEMSFAEAPGIVGVVEKVGPPYRQFTFVDAVGIPTLKDANALFSAKVK